MANTFKLKQSAVSAKIPTTAQLQLGELAVNTYDGRLFTKKNVSGTESIIEFVSNSGTWGISINGNAATATTLQTGRTINGTSFNGSANITTASWGTTRTLTIGNTGKSVDGSAAVSWSLAEIGALQNWYESRTLPVVVNDCVDIGTFSVTFGAIALRVSISVSDIGFSTTQIYDIAGFWNASAGWAIVTPIAGNTSFSGNGFLLEAQGSLGSLLLRIRRTAGTTAGTAAISIANIAKAGTTFTASTAVTAAAPAVTAYFPGSGLQIDAATATWRGDALLTVAGGTLTGNITAPRLISNIAQGTAPLGITSTTVCTNLNADMLDGYHMGTSGNAIPLLSQGNQWTGSQQFRQNGNYFGVPASNSYIEIWTGAANYPLLDFHCSNTDVDYNARLSVSGAASGVGAATVTLECGAFASTGYVNAPRYISTVATGTQPLQVTSTTVCTNLNADLLDGYHVGTYGGTIPLLNAANTWSNTQTVSSTSSQVLLHSGVSPSRTAMLLNNGANLFVLLSDEAVSPSSTYNSLRPFYVSLVTGAVTMAQGVTINNGLTLTGGASITGGLSAYSATNDYTQATVKFGRQNGTHLAIHGYSNGNYLTHVATDANPDPFRIALKTETLSWEHVFAMDGYIVPSQGLRWGSTGSAPPTTSTRSEGTKLVLYPGLGASTVDHGIGINTNTQWYSIPQQSSRCFKWYAGTTPIAALHGDGNHFVYDPGPTTQNTAVTLTAAQIRTCIIQSTPTAGITLTLPTSTNMNDTLWDGGTGMDWSVINLATDGTKTVTLAGNTNHTIVGNAVVAINSSARFRTLKSIYEQNGLPVFTTYRIS